MFIRLCLRCNAQTTTEAINTKKKELKDVVKQCREKDHKKGKKNHKKEKKSEETSPEPKKLKGDEKNKEDKGDAKVWRFFLTLHSSQY